MSFAIRTETEIEASVDQVWDVLTNFKKYTDWNPFIKHIAGVKSVGSKLYVEIKTPSGKEMRFRPTIMKFEENKELRWIGGVLFKGLFDGEHYFVLEKISASKTRLIHGEHFSGLLVTLFSGMLKDTEQGFIALNTALKTRCEERQSCQS